MEEKNILWVCHVPLCVSSLKYLYHASSDRFLSRKEGVLTAESTGRMKKMKKFNFLFFLIKKKNPTLHYQEVGRIFKTASQNMSI